MRSPFVRPGPGKKTFSRLVTLTSRPATSTGALGAARGGEVVHRDDELLLAGALTQGVERGDTDPGVREAPRVAAELARLVVERYHENLARLADLPSADLEGRERAVGVVDHEMEVSLAAMRERGGGLDVHARVAEDLADLGDDPRTILGLDHDLGRHPATVALPAR